jgi:hypothetical protein
VIYRPGLGKLCDSEEAGCCRRTRVGARTGSGPEKDRAKIKDRVKTKDRVGRTVRDLLVHFWN